MPRDGAMVVGNTLAAEVMLILVPVVSGVAIAMSLATVAIEIV